MRWHSGFTLIELLLYLALVAFVAMASVSWIVRLWATCIAYEKKRISLINIMAAHDTLLHDITMAPCMSTSWKVRDPLRLIWRATKESDLCWMQEKDTLVRIEGIYDAKKQQWRKKAKNLVVAGIKKVKFDWYGTDEQVQYVDITLADAYSAVNNRAILMQRSFHENKI